MSAPEAWSDFADEEQYGLRVSELPTGTVTLLLADVEGSTGCGRPSPTR